MSSTVLPTRPGPVVGVRTTRIYCRPICRPGRAPRRENCIPFLSPDVAEAAGFRACKQCRPDVEREVPTIRYGVGVTPLGYAFAARTNRGVCALLLLESDDPAPGLERLRDEVPGAVLIEDRETAGSILARLTAFLIEGDPCSDLALDPRGTPFQRRVWESLRTIPRGETRTYGKRP